MMKNVEVHFASDRSDWETPQPLFNYCDSEWGPFDVDVCADLGNRKVVWFFSKSENGLCQIWAGLKCWMNPPYGEEIADWVGKAHQESARGATVTALLPARTSPPWWHDHVMYAKEIHLIQGRVKFIGARNCAPFPSCIVR